MSPITPAFTPAPLSTAAAGIGAARYVIGIQICRGTRAIFMPKPKINSPTVTSRQGDPVRAETVSRIDRLPPGVAAARRANAISRMVSPRMAYAI